jgi:altronate hydrolase
MSGSDLTWKGYLRSDGTKGIRNLILVVYTVECAKHVAHAIGDGYEDVHVIGFSGCYDNEYAIRLLDAMIVHPNVGAVLAVGLGCEYLKPEKFADIAKRSGRPSFWMYIQDEGGTESTVRKGKSEIERLRSEAAKDSLVPMTLSDLVVGAECGGSDATSGLAANPAVGGVFDRIVDAGGTCIWEEIVEMIGLRETLAERAVDSDAKEEIIRCYDNMERYCREVRQYSVSPGNFTGGLTTIEEKSLGSYAKSGSRPIQGVIRVAEKPCRKGLWLLDSVPDPHFMQFGYTNPNDTEGLMDLISAGSHLVFYTTGCGSVTGSAVAPSVKVTGNSRTYARMTGDMDFDAGRVLSGEINMDKLCEELLRLTVNIASGGKSKSEALGHREYMIMYKYQDSGKGSCREQEK